MQASRSLVAAAFVGAALLTHGASAAILSDDFNGTSLDTALWETSTTNPAGAIMNVDGNGYLVVTPGTTLTSHRAIVASKSSSIDAFSAPLTVSLTDMTIGGKLGATGVANNTFLVYGRSNTNAVGQFFPNGGQMAYGVSLYARNLTTGYNIHVNEFSDNDTDSNPADGVVLYADYALAGAPSGLEVTIEGATRQITIQVLGTTFTATNSDTITRTLSSNFTLENMSVAGAVQARLSIGAINSGAVEEASRLTLGSFSAVVPEPGMFGLLGGMGLILGRRRRADA